jgi:hypothetical protein
MAQTQVEIEVELSGTQKVEKGIKEIEGGLEGIGETGSKLTQALGSTNEKLGEGLEAVLSRERLEKSEKHSENSGHPSPH